MSDTDDLWRVYHREWVTVYGLNAVLNQADPLQDNLEQVLTDGLSEYFERHYAGRVHPEDVAFQGEGVGLTCHAELRLRLWNLKGEFKHYDDAIAYCVDRGWSVNGQFTGLTAVVQRNSADDHQLRSYGVTMLPQP